MLDTNLTRPTRPYGEQSCWRSDSFVERSRLPTRIVIGMHTSLLLSLNSYSYLRRAVIAAPRADRLAPNIRRLADPGVSAHIPRPVHRSIQFAEQPLRPMS